MSEPRFVLSKKKVIDQFSLLKSICNNISYSVKTNFEVATILAKETDSLFSMHSIENVKRFKDFKKIWFFAQGWKQKEIKELIKLGVSKFVVDNVNDLNILLNYIKDKKINIDLLLRMKLKEMTVFTGRYFVFGMTSSEINRLIPILRNNKNIKMLGIHFHRKTQNISEWSYKQELETSLNENTLNDIDIVNVGGGLPAMYKNVSDKTLKGIFEKLKDLIKWLNNKNIKCLLEPGRFISAPAIILETEILNIYDNNIILNCSVYDGAMDTIVYPIKLLVENEGEGKEYVLKGISPCSLDIFRYKVKLKSPKVGDKIRFLNAGAYNYATNFFRKNPIKTVITEK